jgi:hypothetical protein
MIAVMTSDLKKRLTMVAPSASVLIRFDSSAMNDIVVA